MSALFDDAERFDSLIVVGDTVRRVKDATDGHVGPGTYTPSMANSKDFGHIGVSTSRRSKMDPPMSPRSSEYLRYSTGSVIRDGVWFHTSPFLAAGPGPGEYSPPVISSEYDRGRTAKPSSGTIGRQAWDLRGNAGGIPLSNFRDGCTVSSSMGTTPRLAEFSQVALRSGVLFMRGPEDGHRTNGIGPGEYDGVSNRQDPTTKRSYNMRAQHSQFCRERSLSFSGTSSTAKAFLSLAASSSAPRFRGRQNDAADGRPDLHLLGRRTNPGSAAGGGVNRGGRRCMSPASAMLSSMRARADAGANGTKPSGSRSPGAGGNARSLSPKRNRSRSTSPIRGAGGGRHGNGNVNGRVTSRVRPARPVSHIGDPVDFEQQQQHHHHHHSHTEANGGGGGGSRGCRSLSPRSGGRAGGRARASSSSRGAAAPAAPISPRRQHAATPACTTSAPSSPFRGRYNRNAGANSPSSSNRSATGAVARGGGSGGGFGSDAPYTFDYFGLAGQRGVWRGLEAVTAARAEVGIEAPTNNNGNPITVAGGGGVGAGLGGDGASELTGRERGQVPVGGGGGPGSLFPEGMPPKGVCSPAQETRDDLHTYFEAANRTTDALGSTSGSNLPAPPSPRALRPGSA